MCPDKRWKTGTALLINVPPCCEESAVQLMPGQRNLQDTSFDIEGKGQGLRIQRLEDTPQRNPPPPPPPPRIHWRPDKGMLHIHVHTYVQSAKQSDLGAVPYQAGKQNKGLSE